MKLVSISLLTYRSNQGAVNKAVTEESLHRELTSDKTRITKSLASARWSGSHPPPPPENFNMAGIFFLKKIQQNLFPDQTDGFMLR